MYQAIYYFAYYVLCAVLIAWLGQTLHRSGAAFLQDAFRGRPEMVRAFSALLNMGFYLVSVGYVAVSSPNYAPMHRINEVVLTIVGKVGGFLLVLGFVHLFNLFLLVTFRPRSERVARAGELS